jgi:hypothetical protein
LIDDVGAITVGYADQIFSGKSPRHFYRRDAASSPADSYNPFVLRLGITATLASTAARRGTS